MISRLDVVWPDIAFGIFEVLLFFLGLFIVLPSWESCAGSCFSGSLVWYIGPNSTSAGGRPVEVCGVAWYWHRYLLISGFGYFPFILAIFQIFLIAFMKFCTKPLASGSSGVTTAVLIPSYSM